MREMISGRDYDVLAKKNLIVIGECALQRAGLTYHLSNLIQASTIYKDVHNCNNRFFAYYFNPWATKYEYTKTSPLSKYIFEPTPERALIEYIIFKDYFNEGILIEGLQFYIESKFYDLNKLYEVADWFKIQRSLVDYWIKEALEDDYT